jgi:hypothetical protein
LTRAVEEGGTADEAMVFLQRLNRLEAAAALRDVAPPTPGISQVARARTLEEPKRRRWLMPALIAAVVTGGLALGAAPLVSWLTDFPGSAPVSRAPDPAAEPLAVVRPQDMWVQRARELQSGGHLRDALRMLDRIDIGDPVRDEADRLRADVQRDLLATATLDISVPPEAETGR